MALLATKNNIRLVGYFPSPTESGKEIPIFRCSTADTEATIEGAGYFNLIVGEAPVGAVIEVLAGIGGTLKLLRYAVSVNDGTVVTVLQQTYASGA